jgi:hypothetical protein
MIQNMNNRLLMSAIAYSKLAIHHLVLWNIIGVLLYLSYSYNQLDLRIFLLLMGILVIFGTWLLGPRWYSMMMTILLAIFIFLDTYDSQVMLDTVLLSNTIGYLLFGYFSTKGLTYAGKQLNLDS